MKINDGIHAKVPIPCVVSHRLVSDVLICETAYEAGTHNVVPATIIEVAADGSGKGMSLRDECKIRKEEILVLNKTNSSLQDKLSVVSNDLEEAKRSFGGGRESISQSEVKINHDTTLTADFREEIKNLKQKIELLNVDLMPWRSL